MSRRNCICWDSLWASYRSDASLLVAIERGKTRKQEILHLCLPSNSRQGVKLNLLPEFSGHCRRRRTGFFDGGRQSLARYSPILCPVPDLVILGHVDYGTVLRTCYGAIVCHVGSPPEKVTIGLCLNRHETVRLLAIARLGRCLLSAGRSPMADGYWHFHCPECGFGSAELGRLAADQEMHCEICIDEDRGTVRLQRWQPDDALSHHARLRGVLAA
jgi:hypothetical protein